MRTDVKVGIALGLAVVLVAALFLLIQWKEPTAPVSAAAPDESAAPAPPESTAVTPTSDDLMLAAIGQPAEPAAEEDDSSGDVVAVPAVPAYDPYAADFAAAPSVATPIPNDPDPDPAAPASSGFESSDPASVVEIRSAVALVEDPLSLPAGCVPPSEGTEVVSDDVAPDVTPDAGIYTVPSPPVAVDPVAPGVAPAPILPNFYVVQPNDSFWGIAKKLWGDGTKYKLLKAANPRAGILRPGYSLTVPAISAATPTPPPSTVVITPRTPAAASEYVVKAGDSLWSIARKIYGDGTRSKVIFEANRGRIKNMSDLRIGQSLRLPPTAAAAVPPTAMTEIPTE